MRAALPPRAQAVSEGPGLPSRLVASIDVRTRRAADVRDVGVEAFLREELPSLMAERSELAVRAAREMELFTPGPIADCIGLLLLIPPVRRMLVGKMAGGIFGFTGAGTEEVRTETREEAARAARPQSDGPIIEGEFQRIGERPINGAPPRPEDRR